MTGYNVKSYRKTGQQEVPALVSCLKCDREFQSPNKFKIRVCPKCKGSSEWTESGPEGSRFPAAPNIPYAKTKGWEGGDPDAFRRKVSRPSKRNRPRPKTIGRREE